MNQNKDGQQREKFLRIVSDENGSYDLIKVAIQTTGVKNFHDVEDLLQETLVKVFFNQDTYDSTRPIDPWVYTVAANNARDYLRSRGRKPLEFSMDLPMNDKVCDTFLELFEDPLLGPEEIYSMKEDRDSVNRAMEKLTDNLREPLVLHYFEGRDYAHISEILGCPLGTLKSRLNRAREELRALLQAG